jgi:tetratricopeptide (TPR) repeat protein
MPLDQRRGWRAAERLLKQGKVQDALEQLRKISDDAPGGVIALNRLADLLAQGGKRAEAIGYYEKIAKQFERGGFEPKAIAIHKKILRLDPDRLDSAVRLGELYGRQNLQGEARKYLLHAANRYLETQELAKAREVFEQLHAAEPDDLRHRVRLAETRAAEGDTDRAVEDLLGVGDALLDQAAADEAEKIFQRARDLDPESEGALIGLARCLEGGGSVDEAVELLETRLIASERSPRLLGEVARLYESAGRGDDAFTLLREAPVLEIPAETWMRLFAASLERGAADQLWERVDPLFETQAASGGSEALIELLTRLGELETDGHVPALLRLARLHEDGGEVRGAVKALDALAAAYRAHSMEHEAARVLERMRKVAPPDEEPRVAPSRGPRTESTIEPTSIVEREPDEAAAGIADAEAPAVPLNRADEEYASGRITQAEVLEKYDLLPQALEQLEEVVARFPGHVVAQERRVDFIRALEDHARLPEALAQLAVARRAAGDEAGAKLVAAEAVSWRELPSVARRLLERLELTAAPGATPSPTPVAQAPVTAPQASGASSVSEVAGAGREVVIDLDADDDSEAVGDVATGQPRSAPRSKPIVRVPADDLLVEIRTALSEGNKLEARRRLDALVLLGYGGPELDRLRNEIDAAPDEAIVAPVGESVQEAATDASVEVAAPLQAPPDAIVAPSEEAAPLEAPPDAVDAPSEEGAPPEAPPTTEEDEDLTAIKEALEGELLDDDDDPIIPEEPPDQTMEEVLQEFKSRVEEQVDAGDHRTHYELGIGFKEMGLIDEAIRELQLAVGGAELHREACAMIALCHRESQNPNEAVKWYCTALEGETAESEAARGLRYDLAEAFLEAGDTQSALDHFRSVLAIDPSFRDVRGRVDDLEGRLQS